MKRSTLCVLVLLLLFTLGSKRHAQVISELGSQMGSGGAAAAGGGFDFTQDANCQGAWLIFTDGTETSAETNQCSSGDQDPLVQQGGTFLTSTTPSGTASGQDSVDLSAVASTDFAIDDAVGAADEFEAQDFSLGCWSYNNDGAVSGMIMSKNDQNNWELVVNTIEAHRAEVSNTPEQSPTSTNKLNVWENTVMQYEGTAGNEIEIYQNGTLVCDGACDEDLVGVGGTTDDLHVGANETGVAEWPGLLAECWYLDRVLTATELAEIMLCGFDGTADGAARDAAYGTDSCTSSGTPWDWCTGTDAGGVGCGDITTCC